MNKVVQNGTSKENIHPKSKQDGGHWCSNIISFLYWSFRLIYLQKYVERAAPVFGISSSIKTATFLTLCTVWQHDKCLYDWLLTEAKTRWEATIFFWHFHECDFCGDSYSNDVWTCSLWLRLNSVFTLMLREHHLVAYHANIYKYRHIKDALMNGLKRLLN